MTSCETCDNVDPDSRKNRRWEYWTCLRHPRMPGSNFVAPESSVVQDPHMRCIGINGGRCPLWTPIRNGQQDMKLTGAAK